MINEKLNELIDLLDKNLDIKNIKEIKNKITQEEINLINDYRQNKTIESKNKIYKDKLLHSYIESELNINYLIMNINNILRRGKNCENNKW